jgi:predicted acylesterase/phospholipase RssA
VRAHGRSVYHHSTEREREREKRAMASTSGQTPTTKEHERGLKLLVLDGGGMRGVGTLAILRKIKEETGLDVGDFDMIGGTSAGGLIALAALVGLDLDTIEQLFVESGRNVFTSSWVNTAHYHSKRVRSPTLSLPSESASGLTDRPWSLSSCRWWAEARQAASTAQTCGEMSSPAPFAATSTPT